MAARMPARWHRHGRLQGQLLADAPKVATRKASEMALGVVNATLPFIVGGSADLTGSNLTRTKVQRPVTRSDYSGSYIHYGIREHGMAAAMNGIALHGGFSHLWRHLPGLCRLLPPRDPAVGADGRAGRPM